MNEDSDQKLQAFLARTLVPAPLSDRPDRELEEILDRAMPPDGVRGRVLSWRAVAAVAAALVVLAGVLIQLRSGEGGGDPAPPGGGAPTPTIAEMVEIRPEFPKPMFVGTPISAARPNLEKVSRPRIAFRAPAGTVLLSLDAHVDSSDPEPIIGELSMVTDGDKSGADGSYVELGPGHQWVQIDLGTECELWAVLVWHFHKNARAYDDVLLQISDDPDFKSGVETVFNNDDDNSSDLGAGADPAWVETNHGRLIELGGRKARYLRLHSNGNTANEMNHYVEVEVWGKR